MRSISPFVTMGYYHLKTEIIGINFTTSHMRDLFLNNQEQVYSTIYTHLLRFRRLYLRFQIFSCELSLALHLSVVNQKNAIFMPFPNLWLILPAFKKASYFRQLLLPYSPIFFSSSSKCTNDLFENVHSREIS